MKKTPLQQLIEWVDEYVENYGMMPTSFDVNQKATSLLPQERDMVEAAHYEGGYSTNGSTSEAKKYFNETFEQ
jgi:hypothetical protein